MNSIGLYFVIWWRDGFKRRGQRVRGWIDDVDGFLVSGVVSAQGWWVVG